MEIILVRPGKEHGGQVMEYKQAMLAGGDSFDGCAGLEECEDYDQWLDFASRLKAKYAASYVPSEVFLAIRRGDSRVVGIIDFRHPLSDFLRQYGGNIGYSVRPDERKRGYGTKILSLILPVCRRYGENKVLLTCGKENLASQKIILKNGGVLENEVADPWGLSKSGIILRYWIELRPEERGA